MKLLLVQTSFLGDTILSTPVITALKTLHPGAELWVMTTPASQPLLERDPDIAGFIVDDKRGVHRGIGGLWRQSRILKRHKFTRVYSLHKSYRTALMLALAGIPERIGFSTARFSFLYTHRAPRPRELHDVLRNLHIVTSALDPQGAQFIDGSRAAELRLYAPELNEVSLLVQEAARSPYAVLAPSSEWHTKRWQAEGFREVSRELLARGWGVLIIGQKKDRDLGEFVVGETEARNLCGHTSIAELMTVVKNAALVVCNDSMPLHLASAFKVPNVSIFCATSPAFGFGPWNNRAEVVEKKDLPCKPCRRHGGNVCPTGTESCMKDVPAEAVLHAIGRVTADLEKAAQ